MNKALKFGTDWSYDDDEGSNSKTKESSASNKAPKPGRTTAANRGRGQGRGRGGTKKQGAPASAAFSEATEETREEPGPLIFTQFLKKGTKINPIVIADSSSNGKCIFHFCFLSS